MRLTNANNRGKARLVRILGKNFLEEVFGYQVTMYILQSLRYHQLCLAIMNKTSVKDRRAPNNSGMKYGIRVPRKKKEATQFDQENVNKLWANAILKELEALMPMKLFRKLLSSLPKARAKGY